MAMSIEQFCERFGMSVWDSVHASGFNETAMIYVQFEESSGPILKDIGLARNLATDLRQNGLVYQAQEIDAAILRSHAMRRAPAPHTAHGVAADQADPD